MNTDKLKSIIFKKAKGDNVISAQLYQMFFFERILDRISKSRYKYNFILKGGLLLSSIIGEDMRTTKDMDATLKSIQLEKENIMIIMTEILNIDANDNVTFEIVDIKDIREEDEYGGFKINIIGKMERLKVNMFVELTTGDVITPRETEFNYKCIFQDNVIPIFAYSIQTVIAEKFETIISRNISTTRLKDFYDLGILLKENSINKDNTILVKAIKNTFNKRNTSLDITEIKNTIELIKTDKTLKNAWLKYQQKFSWANRISFEEVISKLDELVIMIEEELIAV